MLELLLNWKTIVSIAVSSGGLGFGIYKFVQMRQSRLEERLSELEVTNAVQNEQIKDLHEEDGHIRNSLENLVAQIIQLVKDSK